MEDGTSFSGNSNNVFTTSAGNGGNGIGATPGNNVAGGVADMGVALPGGEHLMMSSSQSAAAIANNTNSNCHVNRTDARLFHLKAIQLQLAI